MNLCEKLLCGLLALYGAVMLVAVWAQECQK